MDRLRSMAQMCPQPCSTVCIGLWIPLDSSSSFSPLLKPNPGCGCTEKCHFDPKPGIIVSIHASSPTFPLCHTAFETIDRELTEKELNSMLLTGPFELGTFHDSMTIPSLYSSCSPDPPSAPQDLCFTNALHSALQYLLVKAAFHLIPKPSQTISAPSPKFPNLTLSLSYSNGSAADVGQPEASAEISAEECFNKSMQVPPTKERLMPS